MDGGLTCLHQVIGFWSSPFCWGLPMFAFTIFLNGRSPPLPVLSWASYAVAFWGTAPRTAYSTCRTAGLIAHEAHEGGDEREE